MNGFALLWGKTLDSSLWVKESKETRLLWMTLLMMKNSEGIIQASLIGLADRAKIAPEECKVSLQILMSPDPDDTSKVEEGRRVREVPGGWQIVNHDLYRFSTEAKREFWKATKAEQRAAKNPAMRKRRRKRNGPLPGEQSATKAIANGDQAAADRITTSALPD